jgi:DNA-binding NarL/FixJ family response regulator
VPTEGPVCVLVVEDFEPYRVLIRTLLAKNPAFQIIGEAEDGEHAVDMAQQLTPDVVLMDIGLPELNGLEAARRIRKAVPSAKIVFLTALNDADVVVEAFRLGACGFIAKTHAASHLLPALEAALRCEASVSDCIGQALDEEAARTAVLGAGFCRSLIKLL